MNHHRPRTRRRKPLFYTPARTELEMAAIAACNAVYGQGCACEGGRTVCDAMMMAAREVLRVTAPEVLRRLADE
jgi:hypothetical protein